MTEQRGEPASESRRAAPAPPPPAESPPSVAPLPATPPPPGPATDASAEEPDADAAPLRKRSLPRRKGFWWSLAAGLVLAGDVFLVLLISGWRADAADFQSRARDLGERIAISKSVDETQQKQIDLLTAQSGGVSSLSQTVQTSADEQATSAHAYRDVALGYQACYDARGEAIAKAWAGASVGDSVAAANAACATADQSSAALNAGN